MHILDGMREGEGRFDVEPDRRSAIACAIAHASAGDAILIAGKGHEDYQIIGTEKHHFDDREVAAEELEKVIWLTLCVFLLAKSLNTPRPIRLSLGILKKKRAANMGFPRGETWLCVCRLAGRTC